MTKNSRHPIKVNTHRQVKSADLPSSKFLSAVVRSVLAAERVIPVGEINLIFVDNKRIRQINRRFLDERGNTDVIAFPYELDRACPDQPFADLFISVDQARQNARVYGETPRRELIRLVIHGLLHVLGYDDHKAKQKKVMWAKQEKLVQQLS